MFYMAVIVLYFEFLDAIASHAVRKTVINSVTQSLSYPVEFEDKKL